MLEILSFPILLQTHINQKVCHHDDRLGTSSFLPVLVDIHAFQIFVLFVSGGFFKLPKLRSIIFFYFFSLINEKILLSYLNPPLFLSTYHLVRLDVKIVKLDQSLKRRKKAEVPPGREIARCFLIAAEVKIYCEVS